MVRTAGRDKGCIQEGEDMSHPVVGVGTRLYVWGSICWEFGKLSTLGLPAVMADWPKCPALGPRELHSPRVLLLAPNPSPAPWGDLTWAPAASEHERPGDGGDNAGLPRTNNSGGCLPMLGLMVAHVWMILARAELMSTSG